MQAEPPVAANRDGGEHLLRCLPRNQSDPPPHGYLGSTITYSSYREAGKTLLLPACGASRGVGRHSWALHTMDQGYTRFGGEPPVSSRLAGLAAH